MSSQYIQKGLEGIVEDHFVVLPGMDRTHLGRNFERRRLFWFTIDKLCPWVELEVVVEGNGFLARLSDEINPNLNFKFAPSR